MIRTLQKLPPFNSHVVGQNAAPHCRIPGKGSEFFSFESATASCVSSGYLVATFSDVCESRLVSAGTPRFVLDPTIVTPALSSYSGAQFEFCMLNAKSREERINLELGLCELLLGSTVLSRD